MSTLVYFRPILFYSAFLLQSHHNTFAQEQRAETRALELR